MSQQLPLTPDPRAGTAWLDSRSDERDALLVALFSRFNHDLRTPLNTIVGWTHLLQQGSVDPARSKHVADVLARNAREQTLLLEDFVDDGRAVLGVLKLDRVPLRVDQLVEHAVERGTPLLTLHGVTVDTRVDAPDATVAGDERRLQRLMYRLLAAVIRRSREAAVVKLAVAADSARCVLTIEAPAQDADWSDAALLDLKLASYVAAMHEATLSIDAAPARAAVLVSLPTRA